jgi:hypothetical protein
MNSFSVRAIFLFLVTFFFLMTAAGAGINWGGRGFDPALKRKDSFRYRLMDEHVPAGVTGIQVDSREIAFANTVQMELASQGQSIASLRCSKTMRHESAPWSCFFDEKKMQSLSGQGKLRVKDRDGVLLLEDDIDFDLVNGYPLKGS